MPATLHHCPASCPRRVAAERPAASRARLPALATKGGETELRRRTARRLDSRSTAWAHLGCQRCDRLCRVRRSWRLCCLAAGQRKTSGCRLLAALGSLSILPIEAEPAKGIGQHGLSFARRKCDSIFAVCSHCKPCG